MHFITYSTHDTSTMCQQLFTSHFSLNFYTIAELTAHVSCTEKLTKGLLEYDMIDWKFVLQYFETFKY